ncbi:MAG: ABC transporter permease [Acidimicrobiia bacterium]|nr:ABC transporter permease [Acidimicrobiia bacterium]
MSRASVLWAIVRKDVREYTRDRLWAFLTVFTLIVTVGLYWVLPDDVDESIRVGVSGISDPLFLSGLETAEAEGLDLVVYPSAEDLEAVVAREADAFATGAVATVIRHDAGVNAPEGADKVNAQLGLAFPDDFVAATSAGERTNVTVYIDAAVPDELELAMSSLVRELAFAIAGQQLPVDTSNPMEVFVVLGEDRVGNQASARDGFRPIFVFLVLLMEMFVMASLIAKEIQDRTVTAILVTPARIGDILAAKGISGAMSGMAQAVIILIAIDSLTPQPALILSLMLLGSIMVAGTAMLAGSTGKDFMSTLFWGMAFMIPLLIPAFAALFPGTASTWIQIMPSYPLVQGLVDVTTYGAGWAETLPELGGLLAWCVALFALGWVVLRRKVQTL